MGAWAPERLLTQFVMSWRLGKRVGGKFHSQKGAESVRALEDWLRKNLDATYEDRSLAQSLLDDLLSALGGK